MPPTYLPVPLPPGAYTYQTGGVLVNLTLPISLALLSLLGGFNLFMLWVLRRGGVGRISQVTTRVLLSMGVADVIVCSSGVAALLLSDFSVLLPFYACLLLSCTVLGSALVSSLHHLLMAFYRWAFLTQPYRNRYKPTRTSTILHLFLCWLAGVAVSCLPYMGFNNYSNLQAPAYSFHGNLSTSVSVSPSRHPHHLDSDMAPYTTSGETPESPVGGVPHLHGYEERHYVPKNQSDSWTSMEEVLKVSLKYNINLPSSRFRLVFHPTPSLRIAFTCSGPAKYCRVPCIYQNVLSLGYLTYIIFLGSVCLPLLAVSGLYLSIFLSVRRHCLSQGRAPSRNSPNSLFYRRQWRVACITALLFSVYFLSRLPFNVLNTVMYACPSCRVPQWAPPLALLCAVFSAGSNPLLYLMRGRAGIIELHCRR